MADFCFQCNIDHYFGPHSDFDHLGEGHPEDTTFAVICEGCSLPGQFHTIVDVRGRCVADDCQMHGERVSPERRKVYESAEAWLVRRSGPLGGLLRLRDRLLGTPWEPGFWHYWRWRYRDWRDPVDLSFDDLEDL